MMRRRVVACGSRRARRRDEGAYGSRRALAIVAVVLLVTSVVGAAACGGSSSGDLGPYRGTWQRVEAGAPDPDLALTIAAQGDGVALTFANLSNGMEQTVAGTIEDGYIACTLPNADGEPAASPPADVPAESDLQIGLGESGQLVIDLVLSDGTLEPIWVYERTDGVSRTP